MRVRYRWRWRFAPYPTHSSALADQPRDEWYLLDASADNRYQPEDVFRAKPYGRMVARRRGHRRLPSDGAAVASLLARGERSAMAIGLSTYAFFWRGSDRMPAPLSLHDMVK